MTQAIPIKALVGFKKVAPADMLARANAVLAGVYAAKDQYPNPPVPAATLKAEIDSLSAAITEALDGGKKAIAERNHQKEVLDKSLRQLGHYVEASCKGDMTTFLLSGFQPMPTTRTPAQPLSQFIRKMDPGQNSGHMRVAIMVVPGALSYESRWAQVGPGGIPGTWTSQPAGKTRPPALITGLTPGTTYAFQVRAVTKSGYTDWSESVTRICI